MKSALVHPSNEGGVDHDQLDPSEDQRGGL
jgi:hypothetical protein